MSCARFILLMITKLNLQEFYNNVNNFMIEGDI